MPNSSSPEPFLPDPNRGASGPLVLPQLPPPAGAERPLAIIAIVMAVVLWLFVRTGGHAPSSRQLTVPVAMTQDARGLSVQPREVLVTLSGPPNEGLGPEEVAAIASLAGRKAGERVPLRIVPPRGFRVLAVEPPDVTATAIAPWAPERER